MFKEMDKIVNEFVGYINTVVEDGEEKPCSSCGIECGEDEYTLDEYSECCDECYRNMSPTRNM
jgi:hypothetical protein